MSCDLVSKDMRLILALTSQHGMSLPTAMALRPR
jgi:hypothetical protein